MLRSLFTYLALLLFVSCNQKTEKKSATDSVQIESPSEKRYFAGTPDIPVSENQVTSSGFGKLILGDSVEKICKYYDCSNTLNFSIWESGKEWPAKKIDLGNDRYIVAGMVNTVDKITLLASNHPTFVTRNGLHAGMPMDSIAALQDSVLSNEEHKAFTYGNSGVWFKADEKTESNYFKSKNKDALKPGYIRELYIICGDC